MLAGVECDVRCALHGRCSALFTVDSCCYVLKLQYMHSGVATDRELVHLTSCGVQHSCSVQALTFEVMCYFRLSEATNFRSTKLSCYVDAALPLRLLNV